MQTLIDTYYSSILALGSAAVIMLLQLLLADFFSIFKKHVPGTAVAGDHADALFRITRTVANTNESAGIFICAIVFCILINASPTYTAYGAWGYVLFRIAYATCYYADFRILRSVCFGFSLLAIAALLSVGWWQVLS